MLNVPDWVMMISNWMIPAIFLLRAIGDFNDVGFFKKRRQTYFGKLDSRVYSPLCLGMGLMGLMVNII